MLIPVQQPRSVGYWRNINTKRRALLALATWFAAIVAGASIGLLWEAAGGLLTLAALAVAFLLMFRFPETATYLLVAGSALFEVYSLDFPDSLTDNAGFFQGLNTSLALPLPLPLFPAETLMVAGLATVVLKRIGEGKSPLQIGPFFWPLAAYTALVAIGYARGIASGGDATAAVWEARGQFHLLPSYLLAVNTLRTRTHLQAAVWLLLIAVAAKALLGVFRYAVTLDLDLSSVAALSRGNSLMAHEESMFFALFLALGLLLWMFRAHRGQLLFIALFSLPVLVAFLANQRRLGVIVLAAAVLIIALMGFVLMPSWRMPLSTLGIIGVILIPAYVAAFNASEGLLGEPARALGSLFWPNERDAGSNEYRVIEAQIVLWNIGISPLTGLGYGREMAMVLPLPDLTDIFSLWAWIPHNTILWVWMRLGLIGLVVLWFFIGRSLIEAGITSRRTQDPYLRVTLILAVIILAGWVLQGAFDMGLTAFRLNILAAIAIGMIATVSALARSEEARPDAPFTRPGPGAG